MPKTTENPIEIRIHFKENISDEKNQALWNQIFDLLSIFDNPINENNP